MIWSHRYYPTRRHQYPSCSGIAAQVPGVIPVVVQVDHRRLAAPGLQTEQLYFCAADGRPAFEAMCERLMGTAASDLATVSGQVDVPVRQGRTMKVERAAGGVCRFKFADLCGADVGAADFGAQYIRFRCTISSGDTVEDLVVEGARSS